jgi:hypothetical protein
MAGLSKAAILSTKDVRVEAFEVKEWGGEVYIRTLSGTERDAFEESFLEDRKRSIRERFLVLTLCDEGGNRLFTDAEIEDLGKKNSIVLNRIFDKAWSINAFRSEDVDAMGKDSSSAQSGSSTSA